MKNHERADRLLEEATEIRTELDSALERGSWNLAIRRAQEVVELALKALLAEMGVEYPRVHDVGSHLSRSVRARGLEVEDATLEWLETVSGRLALQRAPAFYHEAEYGEAGAREAVADAELILGFATELLKRLRTRER